MMSNPEMWAVFAEYFLIPFAIFMLILAGIDWTVKRS